MWDFPETSHSLIARVKDLADGAAWTEFLGIYRPVVYRLARKRGMQDADAQDVTQRVFLSISLAIEGWAPGPNRPPFRAWLVTVTRNAINKALSRRRPDIGAGTSSVAEFLDALPVEDAQASAEFLLESRREALRWASEQIRSEFSETTWMLFWQTAIEGRSIAEVATTTGRSAGAIYMARFRVLQRLKRKVQEVSQLWDL
jgi:RNA polymerase sigma-70 factor (ECF subfamily)